MKQVKILLSTSSKLYIPLTALLAILFALAGSPALWGLPFHRDVSELSAIAFFRWHLLTVPPLLAASEYFSNVKALEILIRVRIKNDRKLFWSQIVTCITVSALWGSLLTLVGMIVDPVESALGAFLLTTLGHILWMSLYLGFYYTAKSISVGLVGTLLFIASTFYIGELWIPACKILPTSWTMVSRSIISDKRGISVEQALGGCVVAICGFLLMIYSINRQRRAKL